MRCETTRSGEFQEQRAPVLFSQEEMLGIVLPQLSQEPDEETVALLGQNVQIMDLNGIRLVIISDDHDDTANGIKPYIADLTVSPHTSSVVVEYLFEEVKDRFERIPFLKGYFKNEVEKIKNVSRIRHTQEMAELARSHGKQVVVADPANSPLYESYKLAMPIAYLLANQVVDMLPVPKHIKTAANIATGAATLSHFVHRHHRLQRTGIFDENNIHALEYLDFDIEDARRLFIAENLIALSQAVQVAPSLGNQIVVRYPRAHAIRILHNISTAESQKGIHETKKALYRLLYPGLETSLRIY